MQYDNNWEAAKMSASSSDKIDKYKCLTCKDILPSKKISDRAS